MKTVAIIGAGASGLACMNILNQTQQFDILVLEQSTKSARKILASGNGRCNVSNKNMNISFYNTSSPLIEKIILDFDITQFFDSLSLKLREEGTLVYPYSLSSLSVKNALLKNTQQVSIIEQCEVKDIKKEKQYQLMTNQGVYYSDYVVIASGSPASDLSGLHNLDMLKKLHIHCLDFTPSLVQLKTKQVYRTLKGLRVKGIAKLYDHQTLIDEKRGEILFTDYGLSGICMMQLSRHLNHVIKPIIHLDLLPDLDLQELAFYKEYGLFHEKLAKLLQEKHLNPKDMIFHVTDTMGIKKAQVCHGGVSLDEVDEHLQLKKYPGIYVCGEALDVDGDCGGYNLHFAFASGTYVARNIIGDCHVKNK